MMEPSKRVVVALERLKGVYFETPEARLSPDEASSIAGLDRPSCDQVLAALVDVRFLTRDSSGAYRRRFTNAYEEGTIQAQAAGR